MVVFQALTWESRDEDESHLISIMGKTEDGDSVCVSTTFRPYFFVKIRKGESDSDMFQHIRKAVDGRIINYEVVKSRDLWGFQNNEQFLFMKLNFNCLADMRFCDSKLKYLKNQSGLLYRVYESNIEPLLRFMHRTNIKSTGWLETGPRCVRANIAKTDIDLYCADWKTLTPLDRDDNAPFVICSFDIECHSSTGLFPDPHVEGDCCFQIAFTLRFLGSEEIYDRTCLCYKNTSDGLEGSNIISFDSEREMLMAFHEYVTGHDIDIMTGWNIFGFDLHYIFTRSVICKCPPEFYYLGKLKEQVCKLSEKKLSSSALGDNVLKLLPMSGRYIFDLFHEVKREKKLDSYSLNFVSETFLGDKKIDMPAKEMFRRFEEGDPHKLMEVAEYCIKDTVLPHRLLDKLCSLLNLIEMAKATWVPISYLSERGQQIKVFSQMSKKAREVGFMIPTIRYGSIKYDGYEGATVLEAHVGAYYKPITALDFEGLYPSIMMAHNLCYSSLVMDPKYDNLPGVTYESFEIGNNTYRFAQNVPSLLPEILEELKKFRKRAKKDMANAGGDMKKVYNGKQLAYKVSMNSVYGFTGAGKGMLPCVPIAATVTAEGRHMIEQTKEHVEKHFPGAVVRYGDTDSVMVEFDVGERTGQDAIQYSWELGEKAAEMCNDLFKKPKNLELEKVYCPYYLYSKKRYAAKLWTKGKDGNMNMDYIDVKGLQLVRRDNTLHVREVCKELLDVLMESHNPDRVIELTKERATELLEGKVPMDKLILSQTLAASYKSNNLAHVQVRDKMKTREPGSEPQSGDRVPYILVKTEDPKAKAYEKAEDPKWALANGVKPDYEYYLTNKFMNPVCDLLEPIVKDPKAEIFTNLLPKKPSRKKTTQKTKIDSFFKPI